MYYSQLTDHLKARFKRLNICPICKNTVSLREDFQVATVKYGRNTIHRFIHSDCLLTNMERGVLNGEPKIIRPVERGV